MRPKPFANLIPSTETFFETVLFLKPFFGIVDPPISTGPTIGGKLSGN